MPSSVADESFDHVRVKLDCFGMTDIGKVRATNQDHFLIADLQKHMRIQASSVPINPDQIFGQTMGKLMLVADGMGGANAGEVASELAVESMAKFLLTSMHWLIQPAQPEVEQFVEDLKAAARFSHEVVRDDAGRDPTHQGMGSTLTVAYLLWPMLYVLHVGDSRCYLFRNGELELLTKDQTLAQHLYEHGHLNQAEFEKSQFHNVLMSAIGAETDLNAVVYRRRLTGGDKLLLCSDGVNAHLNDEQIGQLMGVSASPQSICESIISNVNERGGRDNVTVIVTECSAL